MTRFRERRGRSGAPAFFPAFLLFSFLFFALQIVGSEVFRFDHTAGDQYRIVTEVREDVYVNGRFNNKAEILNRISVEVQKVRDGSGFLEGVFTVSERAWGTAGPYKLSDEVHRSRFWRDEQGRYDIAPEYLMPIVRDVPVFPAESIEPGDSWFAQGREAHDLRRFGIDRPLSVPLDVSYTYVGNERREGAEVAVFEIRTAGTLDLRALASLPGVAPLKIKGTSRQTYLWDIEAGRPYRYQDEFDYVYLISDGSYVEFEGISEGRIVEAKKLDRKKMADEIQKELEDQGVEDTSVRPDEEGVSIVLENIQFPPDSAYLRPREQKKLDAIAEILERYPDRDLLITGHTALAGTAAGRKKLSEERARGVGEYLLSRGVRREDQIIYRGMGATQPIADNRTEEGMRKNRRVEIKILEN